MKNSTSLPRFLGAAAFLGLAGLANAQITPGNLVVVRFGDGVALPTNASTATFLEQYTVGGAVVGTPIAMPIAAAGANLPFTNSGTSTSEGFLTQTSDNQYLMLGGYGTVPGSIGSVVSTASSVVPRVVGRVALSGAIDTSTALGDAYTGLNIRSVCSDNGTQFWMAGSNEGVRYAAALGATTSSVVNIGVTNLRVADINAGQLYVSGNSGIVHGVATVGIGLPTTAGNPTTLLNGFPPAGSYYDYFFADAATIYITLDMGTLPGIEKWVENGSGTWVYQYTLSPGVGIGCRGVTGTVVAGVATLYATTTQILPTSNNLVTVTDTGALSPFTTLATSGANMTYRGVRLVKSGDTPTTTFCAGDAVGTTCLGCGNNGAAGRGCANSGFAAGALLTSTGLASTTADTLLLTCSDMTGPGLFFQANGIGSTLVFGDGMLCASLGIVRLGVGFPGVFPNPPGVATFPNAGAPTAISLNSLAQGQPVLVGGLPTPPTKHYQCWYRDTPTFCTSATFNTSNGITLTWQ